MSILTKKVTMTETAWAALNDMISYSHLINAVHPGTIAYIDASDAETALAEAETIAVTTTYEQASVAEW